VNQRISNSLGEKSGRERTKTVSEWLSSLLTLESWRNGREAKGKDAILSDELHTGFWEPGREGREDEDWCEVS
jgi:hypothetical protein